MQMQAKVESSKNFLLQKYYIAQQKQWLSIFHEILATLFHQREKATSNPV